MGNDVFKIFIVLFLVFVAWVFGSMLYYSFTPPEEMEIEDIIEDHNFFKFIKVSGCVQEYKRSIDNGAYYNEGGGLFTTTTKVYLYNVPCIYRLVDEDNNSIYLVSDYEIKIGSKIEVVILEKIVHNTNDMFYTITKCRYIE